MVNISISLMNSRGYTQSLFLTIKEDRKFCYFYQIPSSDIVDYFCSSVLLFFIVNATCVEYNVPKKLTAGGTDPFVFTCEPTGEGVQRVVWRMFHQEEELRDFFDAMGVGFLDNRITNSDNFRLSGLNDNVLTIDSSERAVVANFYVPSFLMENGREEPTAETLIFGQ